MIGSNRLAEARPVRNPPNSLRSTSRAPSMRRRRSFSNKSSAMVPVFRESLTPLVDQRKAAAAADDVRKAAPFEDGEHQDRNAVLARQRNGRGSHDLQVARQDFEIVEPLEAPCV